MDLDAFRWLLTDDGQALLARAEELDPADPLRAQTALRRHAGAEHAAAALTQAGLRRRAVAKFGDLAARLYFTPDGLEQATRLAVARHRAARLRAFDAPSREECVAERPRSNTPQQALVLLNDPIYVEAARVFAQRLIAEGGGTASKRVHWAFGRLLCRAAEEWEVEALVKLYEKQLAGFRANKDAAAKLVAVGEHPAVGKPAPEELAAWMSVTRVLLNLHETITRY